MDGVCAASCGVCTANSCIVVRIVVQLVLLYFHHLNW